MVKHIKNKDKQLLESLIEKYGSKGVEAAINRLNEWNMWDKPKSDDFYSAAIRQAERNRPRLIDVVDELPKRNHDAQRYKDDPEYHEHIKRLEAQLRKTTDPQEAEYLERRINKLKSLSESVIDGLNEDFSLIKNKMTYEEVVNAFFALRLREPLAEITSKAYPEVEELINYLPNTIEDGGLYRVDKNYGIKFVIGYNRKIYLYYVGINNKYDNAYWKKIDIRNLPEKYAQNCLICLLKILHRLKKENEKNGEELINNENIKQVNLNANKVYTKTHYNYNGEFYIKSCSFEEFIKRHPLSVIHRAPKIFNGKQYYDYELGGDFNDTQYKDYGRRQPELVLYGRYYIDDNTFELIYDNPWEGVYTRKEVDYIPFEAFVRKPR